MKGEREREREGGKGNKRYRDSKNTISTTGRIRKDFTERVGGEGRERAIQMREGGQGKTGPASLAQ